MEIEITQADIEACKANLSWPCNFHSHNHPAMQAIRRVLFQSLRGSDLRLDEVGARAPWPVNPSDDIEVQIRLRRVSDASLIIHKVEIPFSWPAYWNERGHVEDLILIRDDQYREVEAARRLEWISLTQGISFEIPEIAL